MGLVGELMNTQSIIERPKAGGSNSGAKSRGFLTLLCVLVLASSCVSQQVVEERKTSALLLLEESAEWLVAEGIGKYYANGGDFSVIYEPLAEKGVGFYFRDVAVHPDMFLAWIALEKGSITKDILCYARFEHMGTIYEYWEITQGSRRPDFDKRYIRFLVTQADSLTSPVSRGEWARTKGGGRKTKISGSIGSGLTGCPYAPNLEQIKNRGGGPK